MNSGFEKEDLFGAITKLSRAVKRYSANDKDHIRRADALRVFLLKNDDISLQELANRLDVRPPTLSEWIVKLLDKGEITKKRDKADKRIIRCRLTAKGQRAAKEAEVKMSRTNNVFENCLTKEEEEAFVRICEKLYNHLHTEIDAMDMSFEV